MRNINGVKLDLLSLTLTQKISKQTQFSIDARFEIESS